ncbi:MAG: thioredoxin domain-containing protein [Proteobacteria bacterium]|nr:thioredoxin domain-containing protein [Pseudomonadota bacterium]
MTNRLILEKSPYLLQHATNPVDWYPWGDEAFATAKKRDKPIFLSIGYATCHWCHVMEKESFENEEIASFLNENFLAIKVDREERPDIDTIYMDALHLLGQQGGWPLNMFITAEGQPFTGGTYFPPRPAYGRSSFKQALSQISELWQKNRQGLLKNAEEITAALKKNNLHQSRTDPQFPDNALTKCFLQFSQTYDSTFGGFKSQGSNKFPPSMGLMSLLRYYQKTKDSHALEMVEFTLKKMFYGGIYDQIGGGLSRYSTDHQWLVPHFEKMLYDNALFVWAAIECYQVTKKELYREIVDDVLTYIIRDLLSPDGTFYSAEDADSEGEEGKFYVWSYDEIIEVLGQKSGQQSCIIWGITKEGNFEGGKNILHQSLDNSEIAEKLELSQDELIKTINTIKKQLLAERSVRKRPLCDDKILTSWNALMISAFARAGRVFGNPEYGNIALRTATFIFTNMYAEKKTLFRRYREGEVAFEGYLSDYSQLATACLDLFEYNYDIQWFNQALELATKIRSLFRDPGKNYYDTAIDGEDLIRRSKSGYDGVEPSGNSTTALLFQKLHSFGIGNEFLEDSLNIIKSYSSYLEQAGNGFAAMLWAVDYYETSSTQVVIVGDVKEEGEFSLLNELRTEYYPNQITIFVKEFESDNTTNLIPIVSNHKMIKNKTTAYVCQGNTCFAPVQQTADLRKLIQSGRISVS